MLGFIKVKVQCIMPLLKRNKLAILILQILSFTLISLGAQTASGQESDQSHVNASLISSVNSVQSGNAFWVAVRFEIQDDWHTYWRNGGDAGLATSIRWTLPEGWKASEIHWPAPVSLVTGPLTSFGYEEEVLHLVQITPPKRKLEGSEISLAAEVNWLECKTICLPGSASLQLSLPVKEDGENPSALSEMILNAVAQLPQAPQEWTLSATGETDTLLLKIQAPEDTEVPLKDLHFFPYDTGWMDNSGEQLLERQGDQSLLSIPLQYANQYPERINGILVSDAEFIPDGAALEIDLEMASSVEKPSAIAAEKSGNGYLGILLAGFLGGVILNLMPCVFPVLGIKLISLISQSGLSVTEVRKHGLFYTLGILLSFWVLALILLSLRAAGSELGWGFQLQEPGFVFGLTAFLLLFSLNMSGVFEIGTSLLRFAAVGSPRESQAKETSMNSLISGILATVVATPCAAPFLATALGSALVLPATQSLGLFTVIGLGLSSPYLVFTFVPKLIRFLPKPGQWMETLKQGLAFLLYGSVAFLVWVLAGQMGDLAFLISLISFVLIALAAWIFGKWNVPTHSFRVRQATCLGSGILLLGSLLLGWPNQPTGNQISWEPWSHQRVADLQKDKRIIYVDFTARWCATCQTNKLAVFSSPEVLQTIDEFNVALLKADWTNRDPEITRELKKWGRAAIPFNLIYQPGSEKPIILPELLTPSVVLEALRSENE